VLGRAGGVRPDLDVTTRVELGYTDDDALVTVFGGAIQDIDPDLTQTRVTALSPMSRLLALRVEQGYFNQTAGSIVRDLANRAQVPVDTAEDGGTYLAYVADGRVNAYHHIRALADNAGLDVYLTPEGKLVFKRFAGPYTIHIFEYAKHIIALDVRSAPSSADKVQVYGESPADSQGDSAFAWLTKEFHPGEAGSGSARLLLENAALRTRAAAAMAADAALSRLRRQTLTGRLRSLGRPQVKLGDAIRITGAPDDRMNATFQVRSVRHRIAKQTGFITDIAY